MTKLNKLYITVFLILFIISANFLLFVKSFPLLFPLSVTFFLIVNLLTGFTERKITGVRLKFCYHGAQCLLIFFISLIITIIYHIVAGVYFLPENLIMYLLSIVVSSLTHFLLFWNGIISVYCTSVQLGIKHRVIGALCGYIPIVHLFVLKNIIKITLKEVRFETEKNLLNLSRENQQICKTKYPLLMVHGVFFRDVKGLNYWGRVPKELIRNGATLFYGEHQSALSMENSGTEIAERIKEIVKETGCEKVNIIAHSKGGLDCRYAISHSDVASMVASLTTINTPHRGCVFADYLLDKISPKVQNGLAVTYNSAAMKLGDTTPDFMSAVNDLRADTCKKIDKELIPPENVYCQSFGSVLKRATNGKFPLNFSYHLVKYFDGENDGLVSVDSFEWGEKYTLISTEEKRGISHGDMIDLNRENIDGFDVREFYVQLVADLKKRGL